MASCINAIYDVVRPGGPKNTETASVYTCPLSSSTSQVSDMTRSTPNTSAAHPSRLRHVDVHVPQPVIAVAGSVIAIVRR